MNFLVVPKTANIVQENETRKRPAKKPVASVSKPKTNPIELKDLRRYTHEHYRDMNFFSEQYKVVHLWRKCWAYLKHVVISSYK